MGQQNAQAKKVYSCTDFTKVNHQPNIILLKIAGYKGLLGNLIPIPYGGVGGRGKGGGGGGVEKIKKIYTKQS